MNGFINSLNAVLWGPPVVFFFIFTALRFTFKGQFFQFLHIPKIFKSTLGTLTKHRNTTEISPFSAFCSNLGACIGTGNIVGVATAIYAGGAGTVFWMWVSALLSTATAYAENCLGIKYRDKSTAGANRGGVFLYMENGLKMPALSKIYALFFLFSSLGMGNLTQGNSISQALKTGFDIHPLISASAVGILTFFIIIGGLKRLSSFQGAAVPFMTAFYLIISAIVLIKFKNNLLPCLALIFKEAFTLKSLRGFGIFSAMRYGISRGVFSNEAGLGSSTVIHSEVQGKSPQEMGMWAMVEVIVDTVILCTVTALVILVTNPDYTLYGAEMAINAYSKIGIIGEKGIGILTAIFAFTSLSGYSFFGERSFACLFGEQYTFIFKIIYIALAFAGCVTSPESIWTLADIANALMAIPNLFAINCLAKEVEFPEITAKAKGNHKKRAYGKP